MSIEEESVPPVPSAPGGTYPGGPPGGSSDEPGGGPGRRWLWVVVPVAFLVVVAFASSLIHIGYFEFHPGSAHPTASRISAEGVETYAPENDIAFTTVSRRHSTMWSYFWAQFDDDVEIFSEEELFGDRSVEEDRQVNIQLMDTSKQDAVRSALVALGHDVPINVDGVQILGVLEGTAADGALEAGDAIVAVDGERIDQLGDVDRIMAGKTPGTVVSLDVERADGSTTETIKVTLTADQNDPKRGLIGITLQGRNADYQFPFDVQIDSGDVGGPSAGLAFTLGVLDVLTPGELTGGADIAVTGTIDAEGNVGLVGGVPQKTAAVIAGGYDVFIVPRDELEQARERAGDDVRVIGVDTLEDALDALASLGGSGLEIAAG